MVAAVMVPPGMMAAVRARDLAVSCAGLAAGAWLLAGIRTPRPAPGALPGPAGVKPPTGAQADPPAAPDDPTAPQAATRVSVVIPARNEAASLPALLGSLAAQSRPPDEVLVVDDGSTDGTAGVAAALGATVLHPGSPPEGWTGKTWACHTGAEAAAGDVLLFLDADVTLAPDALARLLAEPGAADGAVTVQPSHRTARAYEQLSAVANVVTLMGTGAFTGPPRRPAAMAFGPCILWRRSAYQAAGGHAEPGARGHVAEDIAMARNARAAGVPVTVLAGGDTVTFRMYPDGPGQLLAGWTKMLGQGARWTPPRLQVLVGLWVTGALIGASRLPAFVFHRRASDAALYAAWVAEMAWLMDRAGTWRRWTPAAFPLPLLTFVALFARSAWLAVTGRPARWRGRAVSAR